VFDPARVPAPVRDRLAVIGFWLLPADLRDKVSCWDHLDEGDVAVADNDLRLLGAAAARDPAESPRRGLEMTAGITRAS
jgi:hypothetical protein